MPPRPEAIPRKTLPQNTFDAQVAEVPLRNLRLADVRGVLPQEQGGVTSKAQPVGSLFRCCSLVAYFVVWRGACSLISLEAYFVGRLWGAWLVVCVVVW
mgnify:CR=1 FL=1